MFNTLSYIGNKLNNLNIVWGIGASLLLNHFELIEKPNSICILVDINDIEKADEVFKTIGEENIIAKKEISSTKYFHNFLINSDEVNVISGLRIAHSDGIFKYIFHSNSISGFKEINGISIPLASLEDWYVIYQFLPNSEHKIKLIEKYLLENGIEKPNLLEKALRGNLPLNVRDTIERILI